ncbi:MAG TPA: IclR family transcriptional regulator [Bacillales bacterium]|nr:IclR family transcriptional regulator [Bacillales bacterium]
METKNKDQQVLSSVKNALRVLRSFSMDEPEKTISDLAVSLGLGKSTVSRLMSTLASEEFVIKDPDTHRFRLGLSVLTLGGIITSNLEINKEAAPVVNHLVNDLDETAHLAILDGTDTIYIHKEECNHSIRILTYLGKRNPAYCTSSGKVLLAHSDEDVVEKVVENGLEKYAKNTITDPNKLCSALKKIKERGYASSTDEILEGVTSIAAPIRNYTGKVVAAITVVGPSQRIRQHKIPIYAKKIMDASKEASERLGYDDRYRMNF